MHANHSEIAPIVRELPANLTPSEVVQAVQNGTGTITVTETRTITVQRDSAPTATNHADYDHHYESGDLSSPPPSWPIYMIIAACVVGLLAALADILSQFAVVAQQNPVGITIAVGLLAGGISLAWSAMRGGR